MDDDKFLPKLSQNLLEILDDGEFYDITIEVGSDPYVKIFRAHMNILNYRSSHLRNILSTNKNKSDDGTLTHIKLPNILPEIFQIVLRYIYGGRLSFEGYDVADIIKTLVAASELDLQELVNHLQSFLIKKHATWVEKNFNIIYQTSFENDSLLGLQNYCNDLISKNPDKIFNSLNFSSIPEKVLILLIQNDNLKMNEVQVWKYVLKWGLDQNPGLPSEPESFSVDDFSVLKNTLQQCIPLIKFDNFSSKEFLENVFPYREILPEKLFIELLKLFLDHDRKPVDQPESEETKEPEETKEIKPKAKTHEKIQTESINARNIPTINPTIPIVNPTVPFVNPFINFINPTTRRMINETRPKNTNRIDSRIITLEHAKLISEWINRLNVIASYEFRLIFRGSINGFIDRDFRTVCENQSRTVAVIKVKDSSEILGGYNPIEWKSGSSYDTTFDSFIFSFDENKSIEHHVLSRVWKRKFAISNHTQRGPSFGESDLILRGKNGFNNSFCKQSSYDKPIRTSIDKFSVEEYEVFQII
ncbi:unnamed protein product [Rhizophagus irregularis]|nr:unnamed protein product [Rhizophagus irregularis]